MDYEKVNGGRGHLRRAIRALGMLLFAAAPARSADTDRDAVLRLLAAQDAAVVEVGERLSIAARDLCAAKGWAAGVVVQTRTQYGRAYRDAAARVLRIGHHPTVTFVMPGSAAYRSGLMPGDQIVAIDGQALPSLALARSGARIEDTQQALEALDAGLRDGEASVRILRDTKPLTISLRATPSCHVRFEVRPGSETNASATRDRVQISSDLVDLTPGNIQLPALIAHELSHVILRHEDALKDSWGGLLPGFGKGGAALRASEIAADRLSVYLLALAGYDATAIAPFWEAFGRRTDLGIFSDRTHPDWRARVAAIRGETARVTAQVAAGEPIRPPADLLVTPSR